MRPPPPPIPSLPFWKVLCQSLMHPVAMTVCAKPQTHLVVLGFSGTNTVRWLCGAKVDRGARTLFGTDKKNSESVPQDCFNSPETTQKWLVLLKWFVGRMVSLDDSAHRNSRPNSCVLSCNPHQLMHTAPRKSRWGVRNCTHTGHLHLDNRVGLKLLAR